MLYVRQRKSKDYKVNKSLMKIKYGPVTDVKYIKKNDFEEITLEMKKVFKYLRGFFALVTSVNTDQTSAFHL